MAHEPLKDQNARADDREATTREALQPAREGIHRFRPAPMIADAPLRRLSTGDDPLGGAAVDPPMVAALRRRRGRGAPLPGNVVGPWSDHFGTDMSTVRVHDDAEAGRLARSVQAAAFTYGDDIYVGPGVRRQSGDGLRVLAHEASHVAAQRGGADRGATGPLTVGRADDPAEAAADRAGDAALRALRRSAAAPVVGGAMHDTPLAVPAALRRSTEEPSTLQRFTLPKWMKFGKGGAAQETKSKNPLYGAARPLPATQKDPDRRAGARENADAPGRRANLRGQQGGAQKNIIKITTAGSSYGKWATNEAADVAEGYAPDEGKSGLVGGTKSKEDLEAAWLREGEPNPGQWEKRERPSTSRPVWYSKKDDSKGPEFLFPGPGGVGTVGPMRGRNKKGASGTWDHGSNSIENVVKRSLALIGETMDAREWEPDETRIIIRAHSRGSVAGALLANRLKKKYKDLEVEVTLFDPVPGPAQEDHYREQNLSTMTESTVVYSIRSGYNETVAAFRPMVAKGVKRIIISAQRHGAGLVHGFNYQGRIYKGSRLNDLDPGLYVDLATGEGGAEERDAYPLMRLPDLSTASMERAISLVKMQSTAKAGDLMRPTNIRSAVKSMQKPRALVGA